MKTYSEKEALRLKYIITLILSLLMWIFPGGAISYMLNTLPFFQTNRTGVFILTFVPHTVLLLTLIFTFRFGLNMRITSLVGSDDKKAKKFIRDSLITLIILSFFSVITREGIVYNSDDTAPDKLFFFLLASILLPGQTLAEEIAFRVLPERILTPEGEKLTLLKRLLLSIFCGIFFLLPHIKNVEVTSLSNPAIPLLTYFLWGALSSFLSTSLKSYIPAWAIHSANNLYSVSFVGSKNSTLIGAPLFFSPDGISPLIIVVVIVLFLLVFLFESYITKRGK